MITILPKSTFKSARAPLSVAAAACSCVVTCIYWPDLSLSLALLLAAILLIAMLCMRSYLGVFVVFALLAWFPEMSQTNSEVWSASDFPSLYNFRPIPALYASAFDYLFLIVVVIWLVMVEKPALITAIQSRLTSRILLWGVIGVLALAYGILRGNELYYALREFRVTAYFVLIYLMFTTTVTSKKTAYMFVALIVTMGGIVGIYGVFRHMANVGKLYYGQKLIFYDMGDSTLIYIGLLIIFSILLYQPRWYLYLVVVPMVYTFVFSFRRGAWLGLIGALLIAFRYRSEKRKARTFRLAVIVGALAAIVAVASTTTTRDLVVQRFLSITDTQEDTSNMFRVLDALNALNSIYSHPMFGVGYGGRYEMKYYSEIAAPARFWESVNKTSHNGYLFVLFKTGIVGGVVFLLMMGGYLQFWFRHRKKFENGLDAAMFRGLGAGVIALLITTFTGPIPDTIRSGLFASFLMAASVVLQRSCESKQFPSPQSEPAVAHGASLQ